MASSTSATHFGKSATSICKQTLSTTSVKQHQRKVSPSIQKRPVPHRQSPRSDSSEKLLRKTSPSPTSSEDDDDDDDEPFSETGEEETYWHGPNCPSCGVLLNIDEKNMAQLQHHFKFGCIYSTFFRVMLALETVESSLSEKYQKDSNIFDQGKAKRLCNSFASSEIMSKNQPQLFKEAAKLSDELVGPVDADKFNCNRYKEYLDLLLGIAQLIAADEELIGDIETYLKPFRQEHNDAEKIKCGTRQQEIKTRKWGETFVDLRHSPNDEDFGKELKKITEPKKGKYFLPQSYTFKCHGQ